MLLSNKSSARYGAFILVFFLSIVVAATTGTLVQALDINSDSYKPPSLAAAKRWGDDFCAHWGADGRVGDMVWITSRSGTTNVEVYEGDTSAPVRVNAGGRYCSGHYWDNQVTGDYYDNLGTINRAKINYPKQGANTYFYTSDNNAWINISGLKPGPNTICITVETIYPGLKPQPSPNACSEINIIVKTKWTINGQSYVHKTGQSGPNYQKNVTATPGNTVYWTHDMRASANMDRNVAYRVDKSYSANKSPSGSGSGVKNELFMKWTGDTNYQPGVYSNSAQLRRSITQNDVGAGDRFNGTWLHASALCQNVSWDDGAWDNPNRLPSESACVAVPYNFNLRPSISGFDVDKVIEQDGVIASVNGVITNDGPTKSYQGIRWQLSRFIVKAGGSLPGGADNKQDGCAYYRNVDCGATEGNGSGTGDSSFGVNPKDTTVRTLANQPMGDLEVGDRVCYGMSVMAYKRDLDNNSGNWRHSAARCAIVGKKPKVQVWGSDLSVGRYFANDNSPRIPAVVDTSVSVKAGGAKTFGSWVEYGIFASSTITGASAAGLAGQDGNSSSSQSSWDKLTFANAGHTGASGCNGTIKFGCYTVPAGTGTIPDVAARLAPTATTGSPLAGTVSLDGRNGTFYTNGSLTISGGTINKSNSVIIRASGTVTISGDIRYTAESLNSISEIPQVVIIANDIRINDNVTNVDAWLIANGSNGRIYTCGSNNFTQILTSNTCKEKLTINGPVMAKKLYLTRTSGSGTAAASGEPAEVLNLRADAYLWAIGRSGGQGSVQTINTRELAPRF